MASRNSIRKSTKRQRPNKKRASSVTTGTKSWKTNCCMLKYIKGEEICVSTALAREKKAETVAWCLILSWKSNVESKQKVSNFSGSTGSKSLMMMEALEQLSLGFLDSDREAVFSKAKSLKDSGYRIAADLPKEIVNRCKKLQSKKLVDARKAGKIQTF